MTKGGFLVQYRFAQTILLAYSGDGKSRKKYKMYLGSYGFITLLICYYTYVIRICDYIPLEI
ncbi:hypothetical protein CCP1ISM_100016 [Azospirillaceae bacterium]